MTVFKAIITALALGNSAFGQYGVSTTQTLSDPFFYKIEKEGSVSYLLGSAHTIPAENYPLEVFDAFEKADTFVSEVTHSQLMSARQVEFKAGHSINLQRRELERLKKIFAFMSDSEFSELIENSDTDLLYKLIHAFINQRIKAQFPSENLSAGIDSQLMQRAVTLEKIQIGLDDIEKSLERLQTPALNEDLSQLLSENDPVQFYLECYNRLREGFLNGDPNIVDNYYYAWNCEPKHAKRTTDERTRSWIPKLEEILKQGNAFIVVGAAHVVGRNGLLRILQNKGYTIIKQRPGTTN